MTDDAAESRGPATTGAGPSQAAPSAHPSEPTAGNEPPGAYEPPPADAAPEADLPTAGATGDDVPPGSAGTTPPDATNPPPWFGGVGGGPTFDREKLVRPAQGRYLAGVCAALGRATNTDPVLWRVILGVLSFISGIGILIYLVAWLLIPSEGDTASPIESLLGRGHSGMQPLSVVLLGAGAVLTFGLVVHEGGGFKATLITIAIIAGGALLLKRSGWIGFHQARRAAACRDGGGFPWAGPPRPPREGQQAPPSTAEAAGAPGPAATAEQVPPQAQFTPPTGGYRPPFAPHGPYAPPNGGWAPPRPPRPQRPAKPPRERSKLGRITFFAVLLAIGVLALLSAAGLHVPVSVFFAAALTTIALGLIVGTWFGRARGLIFLAIVAAIGLGASSGAERWGGDNVYRPHSAAAIADRYDFTAGRATLDLRGVNFTGVSKDTEISMKVGRVTVLVPDDVDTTVSMTTDNGHSTIFGREISGRHVDHEVTTDLGADGAGGGTLHLNITTGFAEVEVSR